MLHEVNVLDTAEHAYDSISGLFESEEGKKVYNQLATVGIGDILYNENGYDRFIEGLSQTEVFDAIVDQYSLFLADVIDLEPARVQVAGSIKPLMPEDSTVGEPLSEMRIFIVYTLLMIIRRRVISQQHEA